MFLSTEIEIYLSHRSVDTLFSLGEAENSVISFFDKFIQDIAGAKFL